jgi:predicted aspartyl protease
MLAIRVLAMTGFSVALAIAMPQLAAAQENTSADTTLEIAAAMPVQQEFAIDKSLRMTVPVRINDSAEYAFIVDTGAERTVIANELAALLALKNDKKLRLATISGPATVNSFRVERLSTATVSMENLVAPGLERSNLGAYGLLGIDSLQNKKVDIDMRTATMTVLPAKAKLEGARLDRGMIIVSARRKGGQLILSDATVNGAKVDIIIDTGTQNSLGNQKLRDALLRRNRKGGFIPVLMQSVTGKHVVGDFTQIRSIEIGGFTIGDLPITFSDNYAMGALHLDKRPAIFLGMDALRLFDRVIIDFARKQVSFALPKGVRRIESARLALAGGVVPHPGGLMQK